MKRDEFDLHAKVEDAHWWFRARRRVMHALLRQFAPAARNHLLEIGCGTGGNLRYFEPHFARVSGVDLDDAAAQHSRQRVQGAILHGDFRTVLEGRWDEFDVVLVADVLEHVDDDVGFLRDIVTRMQPGAVLLVTVPANMWLWSAHDVALGHRRRYSKRSLRALWQGLPVAELYVSPFNSLLLPLIASVRLLQSEGAQGGTDLREHGTLQNSILYSVFAAESRLIGRAVFPVGASLVAVLRKQAAP